MHDRRTDRSVESRKEKPDFYKLSAPRPDPTEVHLVKRTVCICWLETEIWVSSEISNPVNHFKIKRERLDQLQDRDQDLLVDPELLEQIYRDRRTRRVNIPGEKRRFSF
jgi:hypothetical protein